jgi:hypothetical protein
MAISPSQLNNDYVTKSDFNEFKGDTRNFRMEFRDFKTEMYVFKDDMKVFRIETKDRFNGIDTRLDGIDKRLDSVDHGLVDLRNEFPRHTGTLIDALKDDRRIISDYVKGLEEKIDKIAGKLLV